MNAVKFQDAENPPRENLTFLLRVPNSQLSIYQDDGANIFGFFEELDQNSVPQFPLEISTSNLKMIFGRAQHEYQQFAEEEVDIKSKVSLALFLLIKHLLSYNDDEATSISLRICLFHFKAQIKSAATLPGCLARYVFMAEESSNASIQRKLDDLKTDLRESRNSVDARLDALDTKVDTKFDSSVDKVIRKIEDPTGFFHWVIPDNRWTPWRVTLLIAIAVILNWVFRLGADIYSFIPK